MYCSHCLSQSDYGPDPYMADLEQMAAERRCDFCAGGYLA